MDSVEQLVAVGVNGARASIGMDVDDAVVLGDFNVLCDIEGETGVTANDDVDIVLLVKTRITGWDLPD